MKQLTLTFLQLTLFISCHTNTPKVQTQSIDEEINKIENSLLPSLKIKDEPTRTFNLFDRMKHYNVPGFSVAIVKNGKLHWAKAYGIANTLEETKVDESTLFQAASISKPVSALAVLKLVQEGKIDLEANVNDYLENWQLEENEFTKDEKVTIRRLLTHTAGLNAHGFAGYKQTDDFPSTIDVLNGKGNSIKVEVINTPGSLWAYSGGGYVILQKVVEDVSGLPFHVFMEKEILKPFGMTKSTYQQPIDVEKYTNISAAYNGDGSLIEGLWHNYPEKGAGGLWTTPTDLVKYCMGIQRALSGESTRVLSQKIVNMMLTKHLKNWGLGPLVQTVDDELIFTHDGSNAGFRADFVAFANKGNAVAIMSNADGGADLGMEFIRSVTKYYNWGIRNQRIIEPKTFSDEHLMKMVGHYSWTKRSSYVVEVVKNGAQLFFIAPDDNGSTELTLTPLSEYNFIDLESNVEVSFKKSNDSEIVGLVWRGLYDFKRIEE